MPGKMCSPEAYRASQLDYHCRDVSILRNVRGLQITAADMNNITNTIKLKDFFRFSNPERITLLIECFRESMIGILFIFKANGNGLVTIFVISQFPNK